MDSFHYNIITLVKSALTGEKYSLSDTLDLAEVYKVAKRHVIVPMIYYGAVNCGVDPSAAEMQQMFMETCTHIAYNEKQMWEIGNIFKAFDNEKIAYLPLKGTILKTFYPKGEMRIMSDADILIKTKEHSKIAPIMQQLGYTLKVESNHEFVWNKGNVHIELHKRLIPSYNKDYYAYYGDGWRLARLGEDSKYHMSNEDQMVYIFTHFAKHYRDAGVGVKHIVDLWVYKNHFEVLDEEYILAELKKLQLDAFYKNAIKTLEVWFADAEPTEQTELITKIIFNSGVYGTHEAHVLSEAVKTTKNLGTAKKAKLKKIIDVIFLPYGRMVIKYPFLRKAPVLLPIMWGVRWFEGLFLKKGAVKANADNLKLMSSEKVNDYQSALNFVGLDFNFKE